MVSSKVETILFDKEALKINTYTNGQKTEKKQMKTLLGTETIMAEKGQLAHEQGLPRTNKAVVGGGKGDRRSEGQKPKQLHLFFRIWPALKGEKIT